MAEFSRISVGTGVELIMDEYSHADSCVDADPDEVWRMVVKGMLSDDGEVGFIFQINGNAEFLF